MRPNKGTRNMKRGTKKEKWFLKLPINDDENMCPKIKCKGFFDFRKKFKYYSDKYDLEFIWVKSPFEINDDFID